MPVPAQVHVRVAVVIHHMLLAEALRCCRTGYRRTSSGHGDVWAYYLVRALWGWLHWWTLLVVGAVSALTLWLREWS